MNNETKIKRFLRIKVAQYCYLVYRDIGIVETQYNARFYSHFNGLGAGSGRIAQCSFERLAIEFNMKKIMWNANNLSGLEALVIHEVCHIISPRENGAHGPVFEKNYQRYAGDLATAINTLVI